MGGCARPANRHFTAIGAEQQSGRFVRVVHGCFNGVFSDVSVRPAEAGNVRLHPLAQGEAEMLKGPFPPKDLTNIMRAIQVKLLEVNKLG